VCDVRIERRERCVVGGSSHDVPTPFTGKGNATRENRTIN
jgi:hypothetical protein